MFIRGFVRKAWDCFLIYCNCYKSENLIEDKTILRSVIDADRQDVWKLARKVAQHLSGMHKPIWHPHTDCGDNVVVVNCRQVSMHGFDWKHTRFFFDRVCFLNIKVEGEILYSKILTPRRMELKNFFSYAQEAKQTIQPIKYMNMILVV